MLATVTNSKQRRAVKRQGVIGSRCIGAYVVLVRIAASTAYRGPIRWIVPAGSQCGMEGEQTLQL